VAANGAVDPSARSGVGGVSDLDASLRRWSDLVALNDAVSDDGGTSGLVAPESGGFGRTLARPAPNGAGCGGKPAAM